ncbi:MAG: RNA polymerase sigma factor [Sedimentisphaerales bacterium]|nr:RNA polymerase sigma factor [Sedimentisphaerales bacterium]
MDEEAAVKTSRAGDKTAFSLLIEQYYKNIYRYAYQFTGSHQDADDICQETFLRAYENIEALKDGKNFKGWIFRIATNLSRKRIKKLKLRDGIVSNFLPQQNGDKQRQPIEELSVREKALLINRELQKMPEQLRMATTLVLIEGQTQKETAEILDCSESTVSRDVEKGRDWLRSRLENLL